MTKAQMESAERIAKALPKLSKESVQYLVGYTEGYADATQKRERDKRDDS